MVMRLLRHVLFTEIMKIEEVLQCALPNWYERFEKVTFPTVVVPIPGDVLEYLKDNGSLVLPMECNRESYDGTEEDYDDFGDVDWNDHSEERESDQKSFPEFSQAIQRHINNFGGDVFIKLNWSCPKDATWVAFNNNLKCSSLSQVYLLLKSSDFVAHDLTQPFKDCEDWSEAAQAVQYSLVLRRWVDINPGTEVRCWVADNQVLAMCQRDTSNFYPHMALEEDSIKQDVLSFFSEHISSRLPLTRFVMDVVRPSKDNVVLVDFNPWGDTTDSLLFSWAELDAWSASLARDDCPVFRCIEEGGGVRPPPFRHYSLPRDVVDLATGEDPAKLIDFLRLKQRTENGDLDSDGSDPE